MIGFNASALNFFASSGLGIQIKSHKPIAKIGVGPSLDDARATHKRINQTQIQWQIQTKIQIST